MVAILDNQIWINTIDEFGESVTVRTVTDSSYSKWGDSSESTSNSTGIKAIVNDITTEEIKQSEGILTMDDKVFFFKPDQSNLSNGNRIVHNSIVYEIISIKKRELSGLDLVIEVIGKKT